MARALQRSQISRVATAFIAGRTRLVSCHGASPLRILNPDATGGVCQLVLSNYGAGLLQGDRVRLEIEVGAKSRVFIGSQGYGRVYRCTTGRGASLAIHGRVAQGALLVSCPDPLVPQAGSRLAQRQRFDLEEGAALVLLDALHAGRHALGESFAYHELSSEVDLRVAGRRLLFDRYVLNPARDNPRMAARFAAGERLLNLYLLGGAFADPSHPLISGLRRRLEGKWLPRLGVPRATRCWSFTPMGNHGHLLRFLTAARREAQAVIAHLGAALAARDLLGYDPCARRM